MSSAVMEARISELEMVLENVLDCFGETAEGYEFDVDDQTIVINTDSDLHQSLSRASDVLYRGGVDAAD